MTQGDIWECNFEQTVEVVKFTTYPDFEFKFSMNEDVFAAHQETETLKRQSIIDKIKEEKEKY